MSNWCASTRPSFGSAWYLGLHPNSKVSLRKDSDPVMRKCAKEGGCVPENKKVEAVFSHFCTLTFLIHLRTYICPL